MRYFDRQLKTPSAASAALILFAVIGSIGLAGCSHNAAIAPEGPTSVAPGQTAAINNLPPSIKTQAMQQAQFGQAESAAMIAQSRKMQQLQAHK